MYNEVELVSEITNDILTRERQVIDLWQRGIDSPTAVAYQCTTIEAIHYGILHGGLLGHTTDNYESMLLPQRGDIYFAPRLSTFPFDKLPELLHEDRIGSRKEFALEECRRAAYARAKTHRICVLLGLPISKYLPLIESLSDKVVAAESEQQLYSLGIKPQELAQAIHDADKRKGIVIALKREALDRYPPSGGDLGSDFRLNVGRQGLSFLFLDGLEVKGPEEFFYLRALASRNKFLQNW